MVKNLVKHGNSWALVIDKPILELLKIDPTTALDISTPDGVTLMVRAVVDEPVPDASLAKASAWMHERYAKTFQRLAN
jgi:antitoxin component of MazEF toxin-antitoxin module